ncbi:MAG: heavy metal translocating P-type ATPase [Bacteroidales bacterium]|nr:heavy metal translocating P-type ATPase [Bacteroidales bacterium]
MSKSKTSKHTFPVLGMSCASCSARVEKTLRQQAGVTEAVVNLAAATAMVEFDSAITSPEVLKSTLQAIGFDLIIEPDEEEAAREADEAREANYRRLKRRTLWAVGLAVPIIVLGMCFMHVEGVDYALWLLSTPVVFWLGRDFFRNAWKQLRHGAANMDTLVATSTGIAYVYSLFTLFFPDFWTARGLTPHVYFEASSVIIAFILLGRLLEARAKGSTSAAIRKLMGLQPKTVTRLTPQGRQETVNIREVKVGDILLTKPGERVAVDGTVVEGSSYVDESMLSGEPVPVSKVPGAQVFAGTINQKGSFSFKAEKVGRATVLAQIVKMVQEAQGSKAPVQQLTDRIASVFVPTIMVVALLTFVAWLTLSPTDGFTRGLHAAVTVLVIACPCALGLATPTAIMVGIGKGAEAGILIKDAESLEMGRRIDTVVLDKTGTVTAGKPEVTDMIWEEEAPHAADIFFSLESRSEHPLAEALTAHLNGQTVTIDDFENHPGAGVSGRVDGIRYLAGNRRLLEQHKISISDKLAAEASRLTAEAKTVIWLADAQKALGIAAIADHIKATSHAAIGRLQENGLDVWMLTGDNAATAEAVAREAGIAHFRAEVLPAGKAEAISAMQAEGRRVAMVGDGINDSAALAQADLSIAMGQGSDVAMAVAGMTIISSDLNKIADALRLSRLTVRTIRQNLFWAFIYNVIGIPIAAGVLYPVCDFMLNPMIAGAAMAMSSVSVVLNSLRLRRRKL